MVGRVIIAIVFATCISATAHGAIDARGIRDIVTGSGSPQDKLAKLLNDESDSERLVNRLEQLLTEWKQTPRPVGVADFDIKSLEKLVTALSHPTPELFPPGSMTEYYCFKNGEKALGDIRCDSKIDAYAYAAYWFNKSNRCWKLLENMRYNKGFEFRSSVQEYLEYNQGKDACVHSLPARCQLAYCWGPADQYGDRVSPCARVHGRGGERPGIR